MTERIPQSPAFKEKLKISPLDKHPNHPNLFELPSSNFIVRKVPVDFLYRSESQISATEAARDLKNLFDELRVKYEIDAPIRFVVADDESGQPSVFTLTEKVQVSPEVTFDFVGYLGILKMLIKYLKDKYKSDDKLMYDIASREQFVYGTLEHSPNPRWYLTDTDPDFVRKSKLDPELGNPFCDFTESLSDELLWLEEQTGEQFSDLHKEINEFMSTLEADMEESN